MKKIEFDTMTDSRGNDNFEAYLATLTEKEQDKLVARILEIEHQGLQVARRMKWVKKLDDDLYEIRCQFSNNIQRVLYFQEKDNKFVITHGFSKKTQKTPAREISKARRMRNKYLGR
ncbi:type II toxin-antitoxin system RelE/ParE family toxin [Salinicoccus bachuensis]|uniref:Type II toxin-antitoxin system RelE/ParE family toxin n=1 Tax=Salinicoccus bachuensis TaxID=3136731 RepID=A0ABZ3CIP3_9STAP